MAKYSPINLNLNISDLSTSQAHRSLVRFLRAKKLFSQEYLYRGADLSEVDWLKNQGYRPVEDTLSDLVEGSVLEPSKFEDRTDIETELIEESMSSVTLQGNSICVYTRKEMELLLEGKLGDNESPIKHASMHDIPVITVYFADHLLNKKAIHKPYVTSFEYEFKDFDNKYKSLKAYIRLIT
jgi:hypothetical protein